MRRFAVGLGLLVVSLLLPAIAAAPVRADQGRNGRRAIAAYRSLQRYLYDAKSGHYREHVGAASAAHAWPLSQAFAATIAIARLEQLPASTMRRLEELRIGPVYAASAGGDVYWDDNEWIAQDFLALGDAHSVARADAIFGAVVRAWDTDETKPCPGGVQWTDAAGNGDRNTVSTVNGALVGLELYSRTNEPQLLYWSRKMLDWADACMLAPNGLYWDHIDDAGNVDTTHWSYNQGSLIGALVLLAQATGDDHPLAQAEGVADRALVYFQDRWLTAEPPEFSAIFFRNLLALASVDHRSDFVAAVQRFADGAYDRRRDPATGLYSFGGTTRLLDQAALVQVYAGLALAGYGNTSGSVATPPTSSTVASP